MTESKLRALVRLLDEDEKHMPLIERHLLDAGRGALPFLQEALQSSNALVQERARRLMDRLRFDELKRRFYTYASLADGEMDLETGAFLVAHYGYPDLDPSRYSQELDRMARQIDAALNDEMYMEDVIDVMNEIIFDQEGFRPDNRRFYDPENSFLNRVIDRKTGIPITLSLIYLLLAERLELPIFGVAVPGHFLIRYDSPVDTVWIDPFNHGAILDREGCEELLKAMGYPLMEEYLAPCTTRQIVARMLNNLSQAYSREGDLFKADEVHNLAQIVLG